MLSPCADEVNGVSDTEYNTLNDLGMMVMMPDRHERDVALSFKIEADSSRVLYALSIPEYIEAWLEAPDAADTEFVFNLVGQETFRIDLYRAEALQARFMAPAVLWGRIRSDISGRQSLRLAPLKRWSICTFCALQMGAFLV